MVAPAARAVGADPDQWEREGGGSKVGAREEESGACNTSSGADNQEPGADNTLEEATSSLWDSPPRQSPIEHQHQDGSLQREEAEVFEKGLPPVLHCCGGGQAGAANLRCFP